MTSRNNRGIDFSGNDTDKWHRISLWNKRLTYKRKPFDARDIKSIGLRPPQSVGQKSKMFLITDVRDDSINVTDREFLAGRAKIPGCHGSAPRAEAGRARDEISRGRARA